MSTGSEQRKYDVVVVGGGHNGLTSAAYLAKAGLSVLVLERLDHIGGAAISAQAFDGLAARLSRYSYLVSLLPQQIVDDLGLELELKSRTTASYTPTVRDGEHTGLLVERPEGTQTAESFRALTGSDKEYEAWKAFYGEVSDFAQAIAPTMLEPLRTEKQMRELVESGTWDALVTNPLNAVIEDRFEDDTVRGVVATDAVIGTFAPLDDPSLVQNRCFLYHVVGNGTGEWLVPVGGMGAVTDELARAAREAGAEIVTGAGVSKIETDGTTATVTWHDGRLTHSVEADRVLANVAPSVLQILLGETPAEPPKGAQLKVNFLLDRLPRLKSGVDPEVAFAGTFHVAEDYSQLQKAYDEASSGTIPSVPPGELYCHSLTDPTILGDLAESGKHTLTYFGVHMPRDLFEDDHDARRDEAVERVLDAINEHLEEPIENCLSVDGNGKPCLEAKTPQDIDHALAMPGGHIFHGDLAWPWAPNRSRMDNPAQRWGVATEIDNILLCGAGARRGGAVSGIAGHNAAQAVLEAHRADHEGADQTGAGEPGSGVATEDAPSSNVEPEDAPSSRAEETGLADTTLAETTQETEATDDATETSVDAAAEAPTVEAGGDETAEMSASDIAEATTADEDPEPADDSRDEAATGDGSGDATGDDTGDDSKPAE